MKQNKAFAEDAGYKERHRAWLSEDDHMFLTPGPLTIYTSLPDTTETADYYNDCYPDVTVSLVFCTQDQLALVAKGA